MNDILIIDDDPDISTLLADVVTRMGCRAHQARTGGEGLKAMEADPIDLVLLDVGLPDGNGLKFLPIFRQAAQPPEVIILTGRGDPDAAERAIQEGAWDYLVKPATVQDITCRIERALAHRRLRRTLNGMVPFKRIGIIGSSAGLNGALERAAQAAATLSNVLICGETGTGKELIARAIHDNSPRADRPFVIVDCTALPETLVESVLFGHTKGAFTGAEKDNDGLIKQAHGGTLLLDEIGELPFAIQQKFLRVIQEHRFRPVSGDREITSDFRLIAATNRNLETMTAEGHFRRDLLFRLRALTIQVPPLRCRLQDIAELARYHIDQLCNINGWHPKEMASDFLQALRHYNWPGNIRELVHAVEEALCAAGSEPILYAHHLPVHVRAVITRMSVKATTPQSSPGEPNSPDFDQYRWRDINAYRAEMDRHYLVRLLAFTRGSRKEACRISGLSRTRLFELIKKYDLTPSGPNMIG